VTAATYDPEARRDTPLALALKERIRREGAISVREYMAACLYDPQHGYYRARTAIGQQGDFVTAPEMSQIFGELLGLWSAVAWQQMGAPPRFDLVEIGPGRGTLMRDALRATRRVPGFLETARVALVESSEMLASVQRSLLADAGLPITWATRLDELIASGDQPRPAIVIANELLDCEPREQLVRSGENWLQRTIALDDTSRLVFATRPFDVGRAGLAGVLALYPAARDGDVVEPSRFDWLLECLAARPRVAAVLIDYGHSGPSVGDTFQGVRRHRYEHPLTSPGEADLTMQVDFAAFARQAGSHAGLKIDGPIPQGEFLGALGAIERASRLMSANPARAAEIEAGIARLMSPTGMGTRFKAIGVRSEHLPPLPGFPVMDIPGSRK
jgi:NADH dehydrogenase [ubiquinone] 1 alpha subcomplex assembly factor 7